MRMMATITTHPGKDTCCSLRLLLYLCKYVFLLARPPNPFNGQMYCCFCCFLPKCPWISKLVCQCLFSIQSACSVWLCLGKYLVVKEYLKVLTNWLDSETGTQRKRGRPAGRFEINYSNELFYITSDETTSMVIKGKQCIDLELYRSKSSRALRAR